MKPLDLEIFFTMHILVKSLNKLYVHFIYLIKTFKLFHGVHRLLTATTCLIYIHCEAKGGKSHPINVKRRSLKIFCEEFLALNLKKEKVFMKNGLSYLNFPNF